MFCLSRFESLEPRFLFAVDVHFSIDASQDVHAISRFIYGVNEPLTGNYSNLTLTRAGGNRWTAYNWENNASNAGNDYYYQNDNYFTGGNTAGGAVAPVLADAALHNAAALITVPMAGYVSADKNGGGDVRYNNNTWNGNGWNNGTPNPNYLSQRFKQSVARKGSAFSLTPSTSDAFVYADEFANWVKTNYPYGQTDPNKPIWFNLDNEPDLWSETHPEVHPAKATYAEMVQKTTAYASAIKDAAPGALIFGPANYGWAGYTRLQSAPDAGGRDFQEYYLQQLQQASTTAGKRLLDVLDVHWYPEAHGTNNIRITSSDSSAATVAARLQAPRSLWDSTYTESSWITQDDIHAPIQLIPRLKTKINTYYPGTKLAIGEYNYGGGSHISGGIAQADVLGIFGRQDMFSASQWRLATDESYIAGAFKMFRNFDGANGTFGDTSIRATTDNTANTSIYASYDSANRNVLTLVAINKTAGPLGAGIALSNLAAGSQASVYQLTSVNSNPVSAGTIAITDPANFNYTMPAYSVTTLKINLATPAPRAWTGAGDKTHWTDAANWSGGTVPTASDDVVIANLASTSNVVIDQGNASVRGFTSNENVTISGTGKLTVNGSTTLNGSLAIQTGGRLVVAAGTGAIVKLASLSITGTGSTLDLADGSLIINTAGSASVRANIEALVRTGFHDFGWDGAGITSNSVRNDISNGIPSALGVLYNNDGSGNRLFYGDGTTLPKFHGVSVDANTVIITKTLLGDGNLDGHIDSVDFALFQAGFDGSAPFSGFAFGDFDYNGVVDSVDFGLFQAGFDASQEEQPLAAGLHELE